MRSIWISAVLSACLATGCVPARIRSSAVMLNDDLATFADLSQPGVDVDPAKWGRARDELLRHARELEQDTK